MIVYCAHGIKLQCTSKNVCFKFSWIFAHSMPAGGSQQVISCVRYSEFFFEMIGIFITWRLRIRSVDSVFKRFCVFRVMCIQVPEFAASDASWHSQVAPHIYSYQTFTSFSSMNTQVQIFRYMQGVWIYQYIWPNILIFCEQSGVAVPEFVRAAHLALSDPGPSNLDWPL